MTCFISRLKIINNIILSYYISYYHIIYHIIILYIILSYYISYYISYYHIIYHIIILYIILYIILSYYISYYHIIYHIIILYIILSYYISYYYYIMIGWVCQWMLVKVRLHIHQKRFGSHIRPISQLSWLYYCYIKKIHVIPLCTTFQWIKQIDCKDFWINARTPWQNDRAENIILSQFINNYIGSKFKIKSYIQFGCLHINHITILHRLIYVNCFAKKIVMWIFGWELIIISLLIIIYIICKRHIILYSKALLWILQVKLWLLAIWSSLMNTCRQYTSTHVLLQAKSETN